MQIPLNSFEIELLNKVIPSKALDNPAQLPFVLRDLAASEQGNAIAGEDHKTIQANAAKNIFEFLRVNDFFYDRGDNQFFLTEKIKHLRQQGTIQQYCEWEAQDAVNSETELETIQARGYLNKDQDPKEHHDKKWQQMDTVDYPVLDENNPTAHHIHHEPHHFETKAGHMTGRGDDKRRTLYITIVVLVIIALVIFTRYYK